ncbi:LCP family protein [bacterium]|nr:LCP family protein [bacterium]
MTFHIDAGFQHLDGATALKYARSRHSTSDFSRSLRQQKILFGIKDKIVGSGLNLDTVEKLYEQYQTYVKTNVTLQEMLWMVKYVNSLNNINSYGLTTNC